MRKITIIGGGQSGLQLAIGLLKAGNSVRVVQNRTAEVQVRTPVAEYALRVVQATRSHPAVQLGASPRAALAWLRAARARALLDDRDYVLPDDLKALAHSTLTHRVFARDGADAAPIVAEIVHRTAVPL